MGYESKIYIVEKGHHKDANGLTYANLIAMVDMCKAGTLVNAFKAPADCYFYVEGDTKVTKDAYGDPLRQATVQDVISALYGLINAGDEYWRYRLLLGVLNSICEQSPYRRPQELTVLHYGY